MNSAISIATAAALALAASARKRGSGQVDDYPYRTKSSARVLPEYVHAQNIAELTRQNPDYRWQKMTRIYPVYEGLIGEDLSNESQKSGLWVTVVADRKTTGWSLTKRVYERTQPMAIAREPAPTLRGGLEILAPIVGRHRRPAVPHLELRPIMGNTGTERSAVRAWIANQPFIVTSRHDPRAFTLIRRQDAALDGIGKVRVRYGDLGESVAIEVGSGRVERSKNPLWMVERLVGQ